MKRGDICLVAGCIAIFVVLILPLHDSITDDTYIHMQYARNLVRDGELAFNRGDPTYGATSPLWVMQLALVYRLGGELAVWSRILSWFFALASIFLVYRLVFLLDGSKLSAGAAALMMSADAWLIRWSAVGMESSFTVFMVLAVLVMSLSATLSFYHAVIFGLALYLAYLTRPEALLLVPLAAFVFLVIRGDKPIHKRFVWLPVFSILFIAWLVLIKKHTGTYFPLTAGAKQGEFLLGGRVFRSALRPLKIAGVTLVLPALAIAAWAVGGGLKDRGRIFPENIQTRRTALLALLWMLALPAAYVVMDFHIISRYLLPVFAVLIILGAISIRRLLSLIFRTQPGAEESGVESNRGSFGAESGDRISGNRTSGIRISGDRKPGQGFTPRPVKTALIIFTALVILQNVIFYHRVVVPPTREFSRGLKEVLVEMGKYLRENARPEEMVATPDIGAIGYYSDLRVLDLGGLVTPEINRMLRTVEWERMIEEGMYLQFGPRYFLDRSKIPWRFADRIRGRVRFVVVRSGTVGNLGITQPGEVCYVLYRLDNAEVGPQP